MTKISQAQRMALFGVMLVLFLSSFNLTVVGTILPKVVAELGGMGLYAWVFTAYSLATTLAIPIFGRFSDIYSRRNILLIGIVLFALGSTLMGLVTSMGQLIALRTVQGIGGGALMSMSIAALADIFGARESSKYQGLTGAVYGLSSLFGPLLGGVLADALGWRWVFPLNLPFALIAFVMIARFLPKSEPHPNTYIDYLGAALLTLGLLPLLIGLSLSGYQGWSSPWVWGQLLGGSALLGAFVWWQHRSPGPIIAPELFRNPVITISALGILFSTASLYAAILYLPLYMQSVKGLSATYSGLVLSPLMMGMVATSTLSGWLMSRQGKYKGLILLGLLVMSVGLLLAGQLGVHSPVWLVVSLAVLLGLGLGPVNPVFNLIVQLAVPKAMIGSAVGTLRFFNQMGGTLGATFFGWVMLRTFQQPGARPATPQILPEPVVQATQTPDVLTNGSLLMQLEGQLTSVAQMEAFQQVLHQLRSLMSLSLDHIFLWAAALSVFAFLITLRLPAQLMEPALTEETPAQP